MIPIFPLVLRSSVGLGYWRTAGISPYMVVNFTLTIIETIDSIKEDKTMYNYVYYVKVHNGGDKVTKYFYDEEKAKNFIDLTVRRNKIFKKNLAILGPIKTIEREGMTIE
jgi:hypothetical protein